MQKDTAGDFQLGFFFGLLRRGAISRREYQRVRRKRLAEIRLERALSHGFRPRQRKRTIPL